MREERERMKKDFDEMRQQLQLELAEVRRKDDALTLSLANSKGSGGVSTAETSARLKEMSDRCL